MFTLNEIIQYHFTQPKRNRDSAMTLALKNAKGYQPDGTFAENFNQLIARCTPPLEDDETEYSIRHAHDNLSNYLMGLEFGFEEIVINDCGWLEQPKWNNFEEIAFRLPKDNSYCNHIEIGQSPNGMWTFGYGATASTWGASSGLSIFNDAYESKELAMLEASKVLEKRLNQNLYTRSTLNSGPKKKSEYVVKVLALVKTFQHSLIGSFSVNNEINFTNLVNPGESVQLALF